MEQRPNSPTNIRAAVAADIPQIYDIWTPTSGIAQTRRGAAYPP